MYRERGGGEVLRYVVWGGWRKGGECAEDVLPRHPHYTQVKTAKPHLKQLQHCVKVLSNEPGSSSIPPTSTSLTAESFEWLTREQTYVIVYLVRSLPPRVTFFPLLLPSFPLLFHPHSLSSLHPSLLPFPFSFLSSSLPPLFPPSSFFPLSIPPPLPQVSVMHSVQAGYTEKALSYADKAMQFIDQQKGLCHALYNSRTEARVSFRNLISKMETLARGGECPPPK